MNQANSQRKPIGTWWLYALALGSTAILSACGGENTITTLTPDEPAGITIPMPDLLFEGEFEGDFDRKNLRPVVTLSNGVALTISADDTSLESWSGDIILKTGRTYSGTVTWIETYQGQLLPLVMRSFDLAVGRDGTAQVTNESSYNTELDNLDFDGDGISNARERSNVTNPFQANDNNDTPTPIEVPAGPDSEGPLPEEKELLVTSLSQMDGVPTMANATLEISIDMPNILFQGNLAGLFSRSNLRPEITLSNGEILEMSSNDANRQTWTGQISVATGATYKAVVTWIEIFDGRDLPLTKRSLDISVGRDGSAQKNSTTGYSFSSPGLDFDGDTSVNIEERRKNTDPYKALQTDGDSPQSVPFPPTSSELPTVVDVIVSRIMTDEAPIIDGLNVTFDSNGNFTGEWASAQQVDQNSERLSISNLMIDANAESPGAIPFRRWAAAHDGRYLYIVVVVDDDGQRFRDSGSEIFADDSLELFLDVDNSKSSSYDSNDFQLTFPMRQPGGAATSKAGVNDGMTLGPNSSTEPLNIDFATGPGRGPDGIRRSIFEQDVYEIRLDLASANITSDAAFGFELQVNDDDDGLGRDSKWGWIHPARDGQDTDLTYLIPSYMGTMKLE